MNMLSALPYSRYRQAKIAAIALLTTAALIVHQMSVIANIVSSGTENIPISEAQDQKPFVIDLAAAREAAARRGNVTVSKAQEVQSKNNQYPLEQGKENVLKLQMYQQRHWTFQLLDGGDRVDCQIYTRPIDTNEVDGHLQSSTDNGGSGKEQYIIHIHGLHHTGTGYLRQTLYEALNNEFSMDGDSSSPVASMQDSMRPYRDSLKEAREKKAKFKELWRELWRKYHVAEDEGHHLQSLYPSFIYRAKEYIDIKGHLRNVGKLVYLADLCNITNDGDHGAGNGLENDVETSESNNKQIGNTLLQQWSQYWDTSATFLLQKTPSLDVLFLEKTKVLPTLHVIIIRHPMTSNSFGLPNINMVWLTAWTHIFEILQEGKVDWYAVVTYEALISHHDQVVKELMEVVRNGMNRYRSDGRVLKRAVSNDENVKRKEVDTYNKVTKQSASSGRRRLEYHNYKNTKTVLGSISPGIKYLFPKDSSVEKWKACLSKPECRSMLRRVTIGILPYFGYLNIGRPQGPLSSSPGPVTVSREFGRVLFSSEGAALNEFRQSHYDGSSYSYIDYTPPLELVAMIKAILDQSQRNKTHS